MADQKQSQHPVQQTRDASSQAQAQDQEQAPRTSAPPSIDEREEQGWDQPESSAQKTPGQEQKPPAEGE